MSLLELEAYASSDPKTSRNKGKRGGFRVLSLDLPHVERTHLLFLYDKGEVDDISAEGKKLMKSLVDKIKGDRS